LNFKFYPTPCGGGVKAPTHSGGGKKAILESPHPLRGWGESCVAKMPHRKTIYIFFLTRFSSVKFGS